MQLVGGVVLVGVGASRTVRDMWNGIMAHVCAEPRQGLQRVLAESLLRGWGADAAVPRRDSVDGIRKRMLWQEYNMRCGASCRGGKLRL